MKNFSTLKSVLLVLFLFFYWGLYSATVEPVNLFKVISPEESLDNYTHPTILRSRYIEINFDQLPSSSDVLGQTDKGRVLKLDLFPDVQIKTTITKAYINKSGTISWIGCIDGFPEGQVILVYRNGIMAGNISFPNGFYQVRLMHDDERISVGGSANRKPHEVFQLDQSKFAPCAEPEAPNLPQEKNSLKNTAGGVVGQGIDTGRSMPHATMFVKETQTVTKNDEGASIDVMVVYTSAARVASGGTAAIETEIDLAVTETNQSYENSGIHQRLNLVHSEEIQYTETGNIFTDRDLLQNPSDNRIDEVHAMRDSCGADVVVMIVEDGGNYCGVAYIMDQVSTDFEAYAFCVVVRSCATGYYSFGHELGHLMSARHDRYVDGTDGLPFSYNHGFVNIPGQWRTIMAYNTHCSDSGTSCTRLDYWSNPEVSFGGEPMGVSEGAINAADNRKTLNNTAQTVAGFRSHGSVATIHLLYPNGWEQLATGTTQVVTWNSYGFTSNVKIQWTQDNGANWETITGSTPNDGTFLWTVPNVIAPSCRLRVCDASDCDPTDISDQPFSITDATSRTITVKSPNGGERLMEDNIVPITWTSAGVGAVAIDYSIDSGASWHTITSYTDNTGSYNWKIPGAESTACLVKITEAGTGILSDTSDAFFTLNTQGIASISLNRTQLNYGASVEGTATSTQTIFIDNNGEGTMNWSIDSDVPWLVYSPTSGNGPAEVRVSVDAVELRPGSYSGTLTVNSPGANNSPKIVTVSLAVKRKSQLQSPFGVFATPENGAVVMSSIPVTGWVLDDIQVENVKIYNGSNYIGDATFVDGARPDVENDYPEYPCNYKAGWGYMLLTNFLPDGGIGTYIINVIATDIEGNTVSLGSKTITCDNAHAVKPFGSLDTPAPGAVVSGGSYTNWGWVLTPQSNRIPTDGSTIRVWVDGVFLGHPHYNIYRADIARLFPGYANSNGAVGFFQLDTTSFKNGLHNIYWTATDSGGNTDGIGSRYFNIRNVISDQVNNRGKNAIPNNSPACYRYRQSGIRKISGNEVPNAIAVNSCIGIKRGYDDKAGYLYLYPDVDGSFSVALEELERVEIDLTGMFQNRSGDFRGYLYTGKTLRPLPVGSTFDRKTGKFYWQPGPGFVGLYSLVFVQNCGIVNEKICEKPFTIKLDVKPKSL